MNDLDQLKELLFGAEKKALDSIAQRVERREDRAADVADILPEAIHRRHQQDGELVESLAQPVGAVLKKEFREDPQTYADALYPVIGPAVRRSIMHALRNFAQQINTAVEHSVSPKGLKWRWQAYRAGVPFGEFVMQKTLQFRVEQAYLISRENGLLLGHVHHEASRIKDSDAVSAMFTAIQDFVKESFSPDRSGRLESADMGEFTLWAMHGPHALLVCVIRGVPPKSLRGELSAILERIHFRHGDAIRAYRGDTTTAPDVTSELERCLRFEAREDAAKKRRGPSRTLLAMLLLIIAGLGWLGVRGYLHGKEMRDLGAALAATAGIHVTDISRSGNRYVVRGLRDPLAPEVADVARGIGLDAEQVSSAMRPFLSLEPDVIVARAAARFGQPEGVRFEVAGNTLRVSGEAPSAWRRQLEATFPGLAGVDELDASGLSSSDLDALVRRVDALDGRRFFFSDGLSYADDGEDALAAYAGEVSELAGQAEAMGLALRALVTASTDATGSPVTNAALATRRAASAFTVLAAAGVDALINPASVEIRAEGDLEPDPSLRYVQVDLALTDGASP